MPSTIGIVASAYHFSPSQLSPKAWWDASDTSTITASGSPAKVSEWRDRSGNGFHLSQGNSTYQPVTGANTVNGLNVLTANGISQLDRTPTTLRKNVTGTTIYVVRRWTSTPTTNRIVFAVIVPGVGVTLANVAAGSVSGKASLGGRTVTTDSFQRLDSTASVSTTNAEIQTAWFDYANTDATQYLGNVADGSTTSFQTATTTSNVDSRITGLDGFNGGNIGLIGYLCEVVYFDVAHSASERSQMWSYLADKWGITL